MHIEGDLKIHDAELAAQSNPQTVNTFDPHWYRRSQAHKTKYPIELDLDIEVTPANVLNDFVMAYCSQTPHREIVKMYRSTDLSVA